MVDNPHQLVLSLAGRSISGKEDPMPPGRPRSWTDAQLIEAVRTSSTRQEILTKLGFRSGGAYTSMVRRATQLGLTLPPGKPRWTDAQLIEAAKDATTMTQITDRLGLPQSGQQNQVLRRHAQEIELKLPNGWHEGRR
jgi:hypothetical protein